VTRKVKSSQNCKQAAGRLGRLSQRIAHERQDMVQHLTTALANTTSVLVIEDLCVAGIVAGILKNHHLAQAIADAGFYAFKRQLVYKAAWYGSWIVLSDRSSPSRTSCSGYGWVDAEPHLSDRTVCCRHPPMACGLVLDRDLVRA